MSDVCGDNRFEIIEAYKKKLIEDTNIESQPDEMAVIDNILLRFWQMGWLPSAQPTQNNTSNALESLDCIDRQAAIAHAISGRTREFEGEKWIRVPEVRESLQTMPSVQPDLSGYSDRLWRNAYERGKRDAQAEWIPCSERLPEDSDFHDFWETPDGAVMWCKETGEIGAGWYYASTKTWCDLWDNGVRDVIAWMPLPEPYKEVQDADVHE